ISRSAGESIFWVMGRYPTEDARRLQVPGLSMVKVPSDRVWVEGPSWQRSSTRARASPETPSVTLPAIWAMRGIAGKTAKRRYCQILLQPEGIHAQRFAERFLTW